MNRPGRQPLDLDTIEARANAATEGPWEWDGWVDPDGTEFWQLRSADGDVLYPVWLNTSQATLDVSAEDRDFIAHARTDVPALIAEVKRLRGLNDARQASDIGDWLDLDDGSEQPDPLDENDHRDRLLGDGTRLHYIEHRRHWCTEPDCTENAPWPMTLSAWAANGPLTFADDPQTPPQATSATETALNRAALAEVAQAAHKLSQAICDWLDLKENQ